MPAPIPDLSAADLDKAIKETATTVVALLLGIVPAVNVTTATDLCAKLSASGSFLLAYRAEIDAKQDAADAREASR